MSDQISYRYVDSNSNTFFAVSPTADRDSQAGFAHTRQMEGRSEQRGCVPLELLDWLRGGNQNRALELAHVATCAPNTCA